MILNPGDSISHPRSCKDELALILLEINAKDQKKETLSSNAHIIPTMIP